MKHVFLNLKRFDIPKEFNGVNSISKPQEWGSYIVRNTQQKLRQYSSTEVEFVQYYPEAHIMNAIATLDTDSPIRIGCQGIHRADTVANGNFGAFTTMRTANSMCAIGCNNTLIGHCEERAEKAGVLAVAGVEDALAINRLLNSEVMSAIQASMSVLYCIGEKSEEQDNWQEVLGAQLDVGLDNVDKSHVVIAYEPIWSIGPGKIPADKEYITKIAKFIKEKTGGMAVVYGGGLKLDNAKMLASISEIDGGLIALTRFNGDIGFYPEEYLDIIHAYLS